MNAPTKPMAHVTTLSTKGQIVLPRDIREHLGWRVGDKLIVEDTSEGVLLRLEPRRTPSRLEDVIGILKWAGPHYAPEEIRRRGQAAFAEEWRRAKENNGVEAGDDAPE